MHKTQLWRKLHGMKAQHDRGQRDITFLQETHLHEEEEKAAAGQYAGMWVFKQDRADEYSFWSSGKDRRAGVAILANPYGAFRLLKPWGEQHWTEHLIMVEGELAGQAFLFMNVYVPSQGAARIQFLRNLREIRIPEDHTLVCGGDFNCVLDRTLDRCGGQGKEDVGARELALFVENKVLVDAGYYNMPSSNTRREVKKYADLHHTHRHTAASGEVGTSRLDRFYITASARRLVRGTVTEESPCKADHRAVLMELHSPKGEVRIKKRPKLYPPPAYVSAAMASMISQELQELRTAVSAPGAHTTAQVWQLFKGKHTTHIRQLKKQARTRMTNGYRLRIKRLKIRLRRLAYGGAEEAEDREEILRSIAQLQEARLASRRRILVARNAWSSKQSTRHFFRRICTKFGDNTIPTLRPTHDRGPRRAKHDKSNIMADSWHDIFNGQAEEKEKIESYIEGLKGNWKDVDLTEIDAEITEAEVTAAIGRCKPGKAVGPDGLGNEWYKDYATELVPILTIVFNDCLNEGITPSSFVEAFIFSISKGGDTSNPLNYRPIALLNTDYKLFTRILAWRVRRHISNLVHSTQFGFVPGRTIHEAIDLFEAAKETCRTGGELTDAQVLLLDFAKAYDSLDRDYLFAVLEAKSFPPKFCRIIRAIHCGTTVQFMANGALSERSEVTSGIRQGCPLAPLLFILAVDLLYDEIENARGLRGITLMESGKARMLRVAGFADDTAIYIQYRNMQHAAIQAVARFSAVSGLRLNVGKSTAIGLAGLTLEDDDDHESSGDPPQVEETNSARYLGHVAGGGDPTDEAWSKAMSALRIRLALAEAKTNTVKQRAAIAAAVIIPKLLYVARDAWPTEHWIKTADWSIRNFVWKAAFKMPERAPVGWINAPVAATAPAKGGLGIPCIREELKAMSAMVVTDWALSSKAQVQTVGAILQRRDLGTAEVIVPDSKEPTTKVGRTLWGTGRPWATKAMAPTGTGKERLDAQAAGLRRVMRHGNGLDTKWSAEGLRIRCDGAVRTAMEQAQRERAGQYGKCQQRAVMRVTWQSLSLYDAQGLRRKWSDYSALTTRAAGDKIEEVMKIQNSEGGEVVFQPVAESLSLESRRAHIFRELCLIVLANYPELIMQWQEEGILTVEHGQEDQHHVFEVVKGQEETIRHTWASRVQTIMWSQEEGAMQSAVAQALEIQPSHVRVAPHPWIHRLSPVWVGRRRWKMTRKKFKKLMRRRQESTVKQTWSKVQQSWKRSSPDIAAALDELDWTRVHKMEAVTAYQTQNIMKLKMGRLRLWTGEGGGFGCSRGECQQQGENGLAHLIWECPAAQVLWRTVIRQGWSEDGPLLEARQRDASEVRDVFSFSLREVPVWLLRWSQGREEISREVVREIAEDLWQLCCATTITAIWRWNVDNVHQVETLRQPLEGAAAQLQKTVKEAMARYRMGLYPLTPESSKRIEVAEKISSRWAREQGSGGSEKADNATEEKAGIAIRSTDDGRG